MNHIELIHKKATAELVGSEKQVSWAEDIRGKFLDQLFGYDEDWSPIGEPQNSKHVDGFYDKKWNPEEKSEATEEMLMALVNGQTSAKWWIDHKGSGEGWVVAVLRGLTM